MINRQMLFIFNTDYYLIPSLFYYIVHAMQMRPSIKVLFTLFTIRGVGT